VLVSIDFKLSVKLLTSILCITSFNPVFRYLRDN
jgi:hypothetical protein